MSKTFRFWPGRDSKSRNRLRFRRLVWEQLERREMLAVGGWNNVLQPLSVLSTPDQNVSPLDALAVINEINSPHYSNAFGRLPENPPPGERPPYFDVNCNGTVDPLDVLQVINHLNGGPKPIGWKSVAVDPQTGKGFISANSCAPQLNEGNSLKTALTSSILVPDNNSAIQLTFQGPAFDKSSVGLIQDAFEILVRDQQGNPIVLPYQPGLDASYNWSEASQPTFGPSVVTSVIGLNTVATISLKGVAAGTLLDVSVRLLNNDRDTGSNVVIRGIEIVPATGPNPTSSRWNTSRNDNSREVIPWSQLEDLSGSFKANFGRTTYTEDRQSLITELSIENQSNATATQELLAVVDSISDLQVSVVAPDGWLADGRPYFRLRPKNSANNLAPTQLSETRELRFANPSGHQFAFEIKTLGILHRGPVEFTSSPILEIQAGQSYRYNASATSSDGAVVRYQLVGGPSSMSINAQSGQLQWITDSSNVGRHNVILRAIDEYGLSADQSFSIDVRSVLVNRPPIITSTPSTDAVISSPFEVQTYATGMGPVAVDVLSQPNGSMSLMTANAGEEQLGYLAGSYQHFGSTNPISIGEPDPSVLGTPFSTGYSVPLGLAPNTFGNFQRDVQGVLTDDVNADGIPDLVVLANLTPSGNWNDANDRGYVILRLGNGEGTFREGWQASLPVVAGRIGRAASAHLKDITGDGRLDLIVTTIATNQTLVYPGNPASLFDAIPIVSANSGNYIVNTQMADLNGDGKLDLILFENEQVQIGGRQGIGIQLGDGKGRFSGSTLLAAANNNGGYGYVADVDGVNGPDLIRLNYNDTRLEVRLNNGSGQFGDTIISVTRSYFNSSNTGARNVSPTSATVDDFNGDGKADALVSTNQGVVLFKGQGNGQFGDGTQSGNAVIVNSNFDDPNWPGIINSDGRGKDLNRDGKLDFVFGDLNNGGNIMIGLGSGTGTFAIQQYNASFDDDIGQGLVKMSRTTPYIALADFNRDGVVDVVVGANQRDQRPGAVGIFLGDLPGTLRAPNFVNSYAYTQDYSSIKGRSGETVIGDFNGDGNADIVTAGGSGFGTALFFAAGDGDGTFAPYQAALGGLQGATSLTALDIDRDGKLDLAWMDGGRFGQAFGLGNGAFQYLPTIPSQGAGAGGVSQQILQTDDFNGDGYPDLVYRLQTGNIDTNINTKIIVLIYDPANRRYRELPDASNLITLTPRAYGFYHDEALGMGDLNNDGVKEFFAFSRNNPNNGTPSRFSIYEQSGNLGNDASTLFRKTVIESPSFIPSEQSIHSFVVGDFNHDGKNDIAYSTHSAATVVMFGNGDFTFRDPTTYLTNGFLLNKGDFNGDGVTDLVTTWGYGFISYSQRPFNSVLLGKADGSFSEQYGFTTATSTTNGLFIGDFNGDGVDDFTGLGGLKHNEAFIGKTKGLSDIATGDINGDGRPDSVGVVAGLNRVKLLHGVVDETFARQPDLFTDLFPVAVELVDADNDHLLDILTANEVGRSVSLFKHTSPTTFARTDIELPVHPTDLVLGDLNGDGKTDAIAISEIDQSLVGLQGGASTFGINLVLPLGFSPSGVAAGDVSGDGKLDMVLSDAAGDRLIVLQGRGDGTFLAPFEIPAIHAPGSIGLADLNADGRTDIIVAQPEDDRVAFLFNRGNGRFTSPQIIPVGDKPISIEIREINRDNKPDILVPNQGDNTVSVILNRFDPNQVWTYKPTAIDPDGDDVLFKLTAAPGGMLLDSSTNTIYWAPMPEQIGQNGVILTANDGRGGSTEQNFTVTVTAPVSVIAPVFTSQPVTTIGADEVYQYAPNVQSASAAPLRFSLTDAPAGMTIDPTTGELTWDARKNGIQLYNNNAASGAPVSYQNYGQIQAPDSPSLRPASVTVEGWFRFEDPKGALYEQLLSKRDSSGNRNLVSFGLEYYYGTLRANVGKPELNGNLATVSSPGPVSFGEWTHVAMTFDDSTKVLTLFINGMNVGSVISPESIGYNDQPLYSGGNYATLSRTRIWNRAKSSQEIQQDMLANVPSDASGLVLDWRFEESRDVSTILDASTAKNHGTLVGKPDFINFPLRVPAFANASSKPVTIRVDDGKGGVATQSFTVTLLSPFKSQVSGVVFDDANANGKWDQRSDDSLLLNGDFASGSAGFETDFVSRRTVSGAGWLGNSQLTIGNAASVLPLTGDFSGHTYGNANDLMLIANGDQQDRTVWRQKVSAVPGQSYDFSFWGMKPNSYEPARLAVRVDGQILGNTISLNDVGDGKWKQFRSSFSAVSSVVSIEIVSLGNTNPLNPGLGGAENSFALDDLLLVRSGARRALVLGSANPYLAGMPNGSTAFGSTAPQGSPPSVPVVPGETLRFRATGTTGSDGFISTKSPDGSVLDANGTVTQGPFNGISKFSGPSYGSLLGVFLDDSAPVGQTPPTALDFRSNGNVPGGTNYTHLAPQVRQLFFIGDGLNATGIEQAIVVPAGATRLFLANSSSSSWQSNGGSFEVQVFNSTSESVQANRFVYADRNRNNRFDLGEVSAVTDGHGVYSFSAPGLSANIGLLGLAGQLQTQPAVPYRAVNLTSMTTRADFGSTSSSANASPKFTSAPVLSAIAPGIYEYEAFAQASNCAPVSYALASGPQGMSIDSVSGFVRWNPIASNAGDNEVLLKATDSEGRFSIQRFVISTSVNTAPVITSVPNPVAVSGVPYEYRIRAQDAEQAQLRFSLSAAPSGMTIDDEGVIQFTPAVLGSFAFTLVVDDAMGRSIEQSATVTVVPGGVNQPPVFLSGPNAIAVINRNYASSLLASDADSDRLRFALDEGPQGLTVSPTGEVQWQPKELGTVAIRVSVTDSRGGRDERVYTIQTVSRVPAPSLEIQSRPLTSAVLGELYRYDVQAREALLFELVKPPVGMSIDPQFGTIRWIPTKDQLGVQSILVRATDLFGHSVEQSFKIAVRSSPLIPTISSAPPTDAVVGQTYLYPVLTRNPSSSPLTYTLPIHPDGMEIDSQSGAITWTPLTSQVGPTVVIVRVSDAAGNYSSQSFSIMVLAGAANRPPTIVSNPSIDAVVGQPYVYTLVANDPENGPVAYAKLIAPSGFSIHPNTGVITWTPSTADLGTVTIILTATDPLGGVAIQSLQIDVRAANRLPVIRSNPNLKVSQGALYQYDVLATDPDREPLFYSLVTAPAGMTIDALGRIRWQTKLDTPLGGRDVVVRVVDGSGGIATQSFTFGVVADTLAPRITIIVGGEPVLYPWTTGPAVVRVIAADDVGLASVELRVDGQPVELAPDGTARVYFSAPGNGRLEARAADAVGNVGTALGRVSMRSGEEDGGGNPVPEAAITSVSDGTTVGGIANIVGTAAAPDFDRYILSYRQNNQSTYKTIINSTTQVTSGMLGKWDTTLLENDSYVLKLEVFDTFGSFSAVEVEVAVSSNLKLGNFQLSFTDITIPVAGIPITLARTYDTLRADRESDFGFGWRLEYRNTDLRTSLPKSGLEDIGIYTPFKPRTRVSLTLPGGVRQGFTFTPEFRVLPGFGQNNNLIVAFPRFTSDRGVTSTLSAGSGTLIANGFGELFSSGGVPWNPANPDFGGYTLTTDDGIRYSIDGTSGLMTRVMDRNGNAIEFSDLGVRSSNGGLNLAIERNVKGRIEKVTDPNGNSTHYAYSTSGDLVSVRDRAGNETKLTYLTSKPHYLESIIDPLGRTGIRTEYGEDGRLKTQSSSSSKVDFVFDLDRLEEVLVDGSGNTYRLRYDNDGNLASMIDALGNQTTLTYDSRGLPTSKSNPLGQLTLYDFDVKGRMIKQTDPLGFSQSFQYDNAGNQIGFTNANGEQTRFEVDALGNVIAKVDASGNRTEYQRTNNGLISRLRDAAGGVVTNTFNEFGFLLKTIDANGNSTNFEYDLVGNKLSNSRTRTTSSGSVNVRESMKYDANGNLIEGTDAEGGKVQLVLDAAGYVVAKIDPLNRRTEVQRTASGDIESTKYADGSLARIGFNSDGRPTSFHGRAGQTLGIITDAMGQVTKFKSPDNTLNPDDNPSRTFTYDALGRLSTFTDESGQSFEFNFESESHGPIAITDSQGASIRRSYDAIGQLMITTNSNGVIVKNTYDSVGNLTSVKVGNEDAALQSFDALGRLTSQTDASGRKTRFRYDAIGQLVAVIDPAGNSVEYTYDEVGNRISHEDQLGRLTRFSYDNLGRVTEIVLPSGENASYEYDMAGRLARAVEFDGKERSYEYDLNDRIVEKRQTDAVNVGIENGPNGLPVRVIDERGTTTYEYDLLDRLIARHDPDGAFIAYTYDMAGNIASTQTPGGMRSYTYDLQRRLTSVSDPQQNVTRYSYNAGGQLLSTDFPTGIKEVRSYTESGLLASVVQSKDNNPISSFVYVRDPVGRIESVRELDGTIQSFQYDAAGRLSLESISNPGQSTRSIEYFRNIAGDVIRVEDSIEGTTTHEYDNAGRLVQSIKNGVVENFSYDANGNLISRGRQGEEATAYSWSPEGRLIAVTIPSSGGPIRIQYRYDYKGNRISRTENGVETKYLVDDNREFAQVLRDYSNSGVATDYTYGLDRISQNRTDQMSYFLGDSRSGTRFLTDTTGMAIAQFQYTAFGKMIVGDPNGTRFLYNGEARDPATGLDDLRARNYDASTGRFISRDRAGAAPGDLVNLPRYQYAGGDPVNNKDPSGEFVPLVALVLGIAGIAVVEGSAFATALIVLETAAGVLGGLFALKEAVAITTGGFKGGVRWQGPILRASAELALGLELGQSELSAEIPATKTNRAKTRTTNHFLIASTVGASIKAGVGTDTADLRSPDVPKTSSPTKLNGFYFRGFGVGGAIFTSIGGGSIQHGQAHGYFYSTPSNPFEGYTMYIPNWVNFGGGFDFAALGWSYYMGYEDYIK